MRDKKLISIFLLILSAGLVFAKEEPQPQDKFGFGIEYLMPAPNRFDKIIDKYSESGAVWSKFNGPGTTWNDIEPKAPAGGRHVYHWKNVDAMVLLAQKAGFKNLIVVLKSNAKWAVEKRKSEGILEVFSAWRGMVSTPPKGRHNLEYYQDYVSAFVERYDLDGQDDMPGLLYPILDYEIESEAQHEVYWIGSADEYLSLLSAAYSAVKKTNPAARVILSGFAFFDIFDEGSKSEKEIERLIEELPLRYPKGDVRHNFGGKFRAQLDFNARILEAKDYFDLVEFHLLSYYKSIPGTVRWIRDQMRKNGYQKPIWMGDAGAVFLPCTDKKGFWAPWSTYTMFSKAPYQNGDEIFEVLAKKKNKHGLKYQEIRQWFDAEQARILVKSLVLAMAEGIEGANWWTWKDEPLLLKTNGVGKSWALCGLLDNDNQTKRPVFYAYKLLIQRLSGFSSVEKLNLVSSEEVETNLRQDIAGYKFVVDNKPAYVIWYTSGSIRSPRGPEKSVILDLSAITSGRDIKVTQLILQRDTDIPFVEIRRPADIPITETPVFIEPANP